MRIIQAAGVIALAFLLFYVFGTEWPIRIVQAIAGSVGNRDEAAIVAQPLPPAMSGDGATPATFAPAAAARLRPGAAYPVVIVVRDGQLCLSAQTRTGAIPVHCSN